MNSIYSKFFLYGIGFINKCSFLFIFLFSVNLAVAGGHLCVTNGVLVDNNTLEFDVLIKSTSEDIEITSYQCALNFNSDIINGGNLTFTYINQSSELTNPPLIQLIINEESSENYLCFSSSIGSDTISTMDRRIGRFRLTNSVNFAYNTTDFHWVTQSFPQTILTGNGFNDLTSQFTFSDLDILLAVENSHQQPLDYSLLQNYPNPFNPSTTIEYSIKEAGNVRLTIFNSLGQIVDLIENDFKAAGNYKVSWNAEQLASGIYYYQIESFSNGGNLAYKAVNKMVLLK